MEALRTPSTVESRFSALEYLINKLTSPVCISNNRVMGVEQNCRPQRSDSGMYDRIVKNEKDLDELGISVVIAKLLSELVEINDCTSANV